MSEYINSREKDFSKFDSMTTAELKDALRANLYFGEDVVSDETAAYITEVIYEREKDEIDAHIPDSHTTLDYIRTKHPMQELDDSSEDMSKTNGAEAEKAKPKLHILRRVASIAAVFAAILILGSAGAYAVGIDILGAIADWTRDVFFFQTAVQPIGSENMDIPEQLEGLAEKLNEDGITEKILPTYVPEGYELANEEYYEDEFERVYIVTLQKDSDKVDDYPMRMMFIKHNKFIEITEFEKDLEDPEIITHNGLDYYIFANTGDYVVMWMNGNLECSITGLPKCEIKKVIDSIY